MAELKGTTMLLNEVLRLAAWTPLSTLGENINDVQFISESIYKFEDGVYLWLSPYNATLEKDPLGPFITAVLWAAGDGAARRVIHMEIESDDGIVTEIPRQFLPQNCGRTYGEILVALRNSKPKTCLETASYRIATDGHFIHRKIETESFAFFFRSPDHDEGEIPYAVSKKLA